MFRHNQLICALQRELTEVVHDRYGEWTTREEYALLAEGEQQVAEAIRCFTAQARDLSDADAEILAEEVRAAFLARSASPQQPRHTAGAFDSSGVVEVFHAGDITITFTVKRERLL